MKIGKVEYYELTKEPFIHNEGYDKRQDEIMQQGYGFERYIGKVIEVYALVVDEHKCQLRFSGECNGTVVYVMTMNETIVGGYSYINAKGIAPGGYTDFHGNTVDEIYDGNSGIWRDYYREILMTELPQ